MKRFILILFTSLVLCASAAQTDSFSFSGENIFAKYSFVENTQRLNSSQDQDIIPVPDCFPCDDRPPQETCQKIYLCTCPLIFCDLTGGPVCIEIGEICY